ncbi:MAG: Tm-1-like ATP-binding domain-containing protein, partial [Dehalococcoidales bacterium]
MNGNIIILVMAEEKWEEADFLRKQIESRGYKAQFLDIGLILEPEGPCDITRGEVIAASGQDPKEVAKITDRGKRMPIMVAGGIIKVGQLHSEGNLQGIISIGGTTGTQMGAEIMRSLPYGVPKFGVSSTVSLLGFASRAFGTGDITMMNSVVDFTGLKGVMMRNALARAAGAICGMVDAAAKVPIVLPGKDEKPLVAIT